jgi:hypothetical protein
MNNFIECQSTSFGYYCTLPKDHNGQHEAWAETMPLAEPFRVWPSDATRLESEIRLLDEQGL